MNQNNNQNFRSQIYTQVAITLIIGFGLIILTLLLNINRWLELIITLPLFAIIAWRIHHILSPLSKLVKDVSSLVHHPPQTKNEFDFLSMTFNYMANYVKDASELLSYEQNNAGLEKQRLLTVINSMTEGIIAIDNDNLVVASNTAAERITNYSSVDLFNQPITQMIKLKNDDGIEISIDEICQKSIDILNPNPNDKRSHSLNLIGKSNYQTPVELVSAKIISQVPVNLKCMLILKNNSQAQDLQHIQIDFVSMASHELRTPLTSIIGYLSVFMDENKSILKKDQLEFLDRIMISAKQLASLIENLLNVSKVERRAFSVTTQALDWLTVVHKAVDDNKIAAVQKGLQLNLVTPTSPIPKVSADPIRIIEVINNLISNAINYTDTGGKIEVSVSVGNNEVITSVKDSGHGIPTESLTHLFTKFFRVQTALDTSSNSKGTGLGLYLSKSIIDLHHGRIWVESEVGKGSTFHFSLPIASVETSPMLNLPNLPLTSH